MIDRILALARLRLHESRSARLGLLVPAGFVLGLGAALWAPGGSDAARAAIADRSALLLVAALGVLAAAVPTALGFPADVRSGVADGVLATPTRRLAVVVGGTLGYGLFASLILVGALGAAVLGLEAGGLGGGARAPSWRFAPIGQADDAAQLTLDSATHRVVFAVPDLSIASGEIVARLDPKPIYEGGTFERTSECRIALGRPRESSRTATTVQFTPGRPFIARLPADDLESGELVHLTIHRPSGSWGLALAPGSIQVATKRELFVSSALKAALCLVPLLFLVAAGAGVGSVRFGAPTALGLALFLVAALAGQDIVRDAATFVVRTAETQAAAAVGHEGHDHAGHDHAGQVELSPIQVGLARGALHVLDLLPPLDAFDRSSDLADGQAVSLARVPVAARAALPGLVVLLLVGWGLLARRDVLPL